MENNNFRKASNYFNTKYGDAYNDSNNIWEFGWSNLPRVIQYSTDISSDAKICMTVLIDLKLNTNFPNPRLYYPSQKRIGFLTGLSVSAVSRALTELNKAEIIGKMRVGQGKQNIYCLLNPPQDFVTNAIKRRVIVEEIRQGRNDWMDFDDKGNVIIENEVERKETQDRINALICKYANQRNQPCKSAFPNQGGRNAPGTAPTLDIDNSELSSVGLSSDESSSAPIIPKSINSSPSIPESAKSALSGALDEDELVIYVQTVVDYFNGLKGRYPNKVRSKITRPVKRTTVDKYKDGKYRAIVKWYQQGIPANHVCDLLQEWIPKLKTSVGGSLNYFENKVIDYISPERQAELDAYKAKLLEEYDERESREYGRINQR